jgi:hypothetical protein
MEQVHLGKAQKLEEVEAEVEAGWAAIALVQDPEDFACVQVVERK